MSRRHTDKELNQVWIEILGYQVGDRIRLIHPAYKGLQGVIKGILRDTKGEFMFYEVEVPRREAILLFIKEEFELDE